MNTENTSPDNSSQVETVKNQKTEEAKRRVEQRHEELRPLVPPATKAIIRGFPKGWVMSREAILLDTGASDETWKLWVDADLPVINDKGMKHDFVDTDVLAAFLTSNAKLGERPSAARKARQQQRRKR